MKNLIFGLGLVSCVLTGCASIPDQNIVGNLASYKQVKHLVINKNPLFETWMSGDEKRGLRDIQKIIENSKSEEAWVYSPEKKLWIEVGKKEKSQEVCIDNNLMRRLMAYYNKINLYHTHPSNNDYRDVKEMFANCMPAKNDLYYMIFWSLKFREINPGGKLKCGVCSDIGVVEYSLTERGIKYFFDNNLMINFEKAAVRKEYGNRAYFSSNNIEELCKKLSDENIVMKFVEY